MTLDVYADNTARKIVAYASDPTRNETTKRVPKYIKRTGSKKIPIGKECHGNKQNINPKRRTRTNNGKE